MAYQGPPLLGDILAQAGAIKGQQQRQQMGTLQLQQAQQAQSDQQGIDSAIQQNPNVTLADLAGKYGMAGVQASGQLGTARTQDSQFQALQQLHNLQQQKFLTDQVIADPTKMPQVSQQLQQIGVQGHPDGWEHLPPQQIQANASKASQALDAQIQALTAQLVPPDKQYESQQTAKQNQYKQEGPGGELARNQNTITAENTRAAAGRAVTMRGQDLENARGLKPQMVEVHNPDGSTTQKWIQPGQLDGPAVGATPPGAKLTETQGNAKAFGLRAQDANQTLESMISGPGGYNPTGVWAMKDALSAGGVTNFLASDAGQKYQNVAKAFIAPILRKESGAAISKDEWTQAKQLYIPIPGDSKTVLEQKAQNRKDAVEGLRVQAGPSGLPPIQGAAAGSVPTATGPNGQKLYLRNGQWSPQ